MKLHVDQEADALYLRLDDSKIIESEVDVLRVLFSDARIEERREHGRMNLTRFLLSVLAIVSGPYAAAEVAPLPEMHWADESSGRLFSKDPSVIRFGDEYLMYYSLPGPVGGGMGGWSVGIARSKDLVKWEKAGVVGPAQECDKKGLAAPVAWVHEGKVHLFYQTYGNGPKDAICHAWSEDGLNFTRNPENPVFAPKGDWTVGRAIDAS